MLAAVLTCEFLVSPVLVTTDCVAARVDDLVALRGVIRRNDHPVLIEDGAMERLVSDGRYPTENIFEDCLHRAGVVAYSAQDVSRMVNQIARQAIEISDSTPDYLIDVVANACTPDITGLDPARRQVLVDLFALLAARAQCQGLCEALLHSCEINRFDSVEIDLQLKYIVPQGDLSCPTNLRHELPIFHSYSDLLDAQDSLAMFSSACTEHAVKFAIFLRARAKRRAAGADISDFSLESFGMGGDFVDSLKRNQCYGDQKFAGATFEAAADIVSGISGREIGDFWTGESGSAAKTWCGYEALRTHITKKNEAIRLMFWQDAEGFLVLANVGPKNELQISRP